MEDLITTHRVSWAIVAVVLTLIVRFFRKLHYQRSLVKGLPGPPHSYLWGSLKAMGEIVSKQPKYCAPQCYALPIKERWNLPDVFYTDPWPFADATMMIFNTEVLEQIAIKNSLPKHPAIDAFVQHIGGPGNLVTAESQEWKKWRSAFNPGFSQTHLMTLVPSIVDECSIFRSILTKRAENNELFRMEQATTRLTVDIIGKVVLDVAFNTQTGSNVLVDCLLDQIHWIPIGAQFNPWELVDPRRPIMLKYNTWRMNRYISQHLEERFATKASRGKTKHVVDLALEAYLKEVKGTTGSTENVKGLDAEFKTAAISNMKVFLFAGHDTTSGAICYAYYYLAKNPETLAKARKELDDVFGPDTSTVAEQLKKDPYLLNRLDYILAILRETLRLQPPASTIRKAPKDFVLRHPDTGEHLPTEGMMIWAVNVGFGRSEKYWPNASAFMPERFLDGSWNKDAWVPFSKGVRNCIGQELAIIESKIILAMTLREFDVKVALDELTKLKGDGSRYPSDTDGVQSQFGEDLYQIQLGTAKPREGMPCRVTLRS